MSRRESSLLKESKDLAELYGIKPQKKFGQNFLIDDLTYIDIIESADLDKSDRVLEVGPGLGFLTMSLAERVAEVAAVELDRKLAKVLPERLQLFGYNNTHVHQANILDFPRITGLEDFFDKPYKVVANLPYNITSVFLRKFLESEHKPVSLTLLLQKEVAQRICDRPGQMSLLALSVQFFAEAKYCFAVDKTKFWPKPQVQSGVVHLVVKNKLPLPEKSLKSFWRLVHIGFSAKRKMLKKNLAAALDLDTEDFAKILVQIKINPEARAQELSLDNWLKLFALLEHGVL
ncbi:ribosomal RNA small subunit methyltransferase A [Candidatus Falkowbacteria bacterium CG10_big_fil_rev_8_21_14_0_10_37_14]|uniref:Ribosomal RNA small subunit methyltransferase A n=1 Tax=Candidatus Falkowbacteria bacterium CG10_big_fil_rev_8_21_14_0_10_37_14 TaxID=1974561 RepID=A0A2M6WSZ2_9BACT|nr:ribosomal RNA small subunit methyltransferase A [Candidatus Falkowbacteria bacterium]PIT95929.1 MAG: ribosomal RNA small subunit methyltransferase A [Candidatus Falkowbacteria bacterium CG10_big_fil_rev_8_21_14_0_10_37_14]